MKSIGSVAPGRVNLIGEHTDYNGGMVLPAALGVAIEALLTPRSDRQIYVSSEGGLGLARRSVDDRATGDWSDATVGAIIEANRIGLLEGGSDLVIRSTIPSGAGLSSSAALIVAILKASRDVAGANHSDVDLALAARRVENRYMSVPCGIMDQMAVAIAKPGQAMALDTDTLEYSLLDLPLDHDMVVVHSGQTRKLTDGRYAERKAECDEARRHFGTESLCRIGLDAIADADIPSVIRKRARHCASEHRRAVDAIDTLAQGDMDTFGMLMNESHESMRRDFQISLPEIDRLVGTANEAGALGARLTGGGFGGCIVACVPTEMRDDWLKIVRQAHPNSRFISAISGRRLAE